MIYRKEHPRSFPLGTPEWHITTEEVGRVANGPKLTKQQEIQGKQEIERVTARRTRQAKLDLLRDQIMQFMKHRSGFYGLDTKEAVQYLKEKLGLDYSNSLIREALSSLINKGKIKRANLRSGINTPDAVYGVSGVIFYLDGLPDDRFPPEFLEFLESSRAPAVLEVPA